MIADVARGAIALFTVRSFVLGTRVLTLLAIARFGTGSELASISFVIALSELLRTVADWGLDTWSVRAIALARDARARAHIVSSTARLKVFASLLGGSVALLICAATLDANGWALGAGACVLLLSNQITGLAIAYFQATNGLLRLYVLIAPCVLTMAGVLVALVVHDSAFGAFFVLCLGEVVTAVLALRVLYSSGVLKVPEGPDSIGTDSIGTDSIGPGAIVRQSMPLAILNIIVGIYTRIDIMLLAQISAALVATYTVAHRLFLPFQVAVGALGAAMFATSARRLGDGEEVRLSSFYRHSLLPTLLLASALSVALYASGTLIVTWVLPVYVDSLETLRVLCFVLIVNAINTAMTSFALAHGRFRSVALIAAGDLAFTSTAMLLLVPVSGAVAAGEALLMGALLNGLAMWMVLRRIEANRDNQARAQ